MEYNMPQEDADRKVAESALRSFGFRQFTPAGTITVPREVLTQAGITPAADLVRCRSLDPGKILLEVVGDAEEVVATLQRMTRLSREQHAEGESTTYEVDPKSPPSSG